MNVKKAIAAALMVGTLTTAGAAFAMSHDGPRHGGNPMSWEQRGGHPNGHSEGYGPRQWEQKGPRHDGGRWDMGRPHEMSRRDDRFRRPVHDRWGAGRNPRGGRGMMRPQMGRW